MSRSNENETALWSSISSQNTAIPKLRRTKIANNMSRSPKRQVAVLRLSSGMGCQVLSRESTCLAHSPPQSNHYRSLSKGSAKTARPRSSCSACSLGQDSRVALAGTAASFSPSGHDPVPASERGRLRPPEAGLAGAVPPGLRETPERRRRAEGVGRFPCLAETGTRRRGAEGGGALR
jgi:hypothetical protein